MKTFKAQAIVRVESGQVKLSAEQAAGRRHCLDPVKVKEDGSGVYQVKSAIQFKAGEEFGFDGDAGRNGVLRDPEAEQLARMEDDAQRIAVATAKIREDAEAAINRVRDDWKKAIEAQAKEFADQVARVGEGYEPRLKAAAEDAAALQSQIDAGVEGLLSKLRPETAELVRAELADTATDNGAGAAG